MVRCTLIVCAVLCVSCAGSHGADDVGTGLDAATQELVDASSRADGAEADGSSRDATAAADAATHVLDDRDASPSDAAQASRDGGAVSSGACRKAADCPTGATCRAPDYTEAPCRGIACLSDIATSCTRDEDCGANQRCHVYQDRNCGAPYRACGAPCGTDVDCMDTRCQPDGRCLPTQHCSLTKTCPADFHCDAMLGSVATGCVRNGCRADAECDGGVCLFEQCHASPGVCRAPPMVCTAP